MKKLCLFVTMALLLAFSGCEEEGEWDPNDYQTVILDATNPFYHFKNGRTAQYTDDIDGMGIINEPWCTSLPALCGKYVVSNQSSFADVSKPTSSEWEQTCDEVELQSILVFKLDDGTYALVKVANDVYTEGDNGCSHTVTLHINYPAF